LAAYNAGDGRVARLLDKAPGTFERIADKLPIETQMYVPKVLATVALREEVDPATLPPPRVMLARTP
jgi:membrane-bound lytic murein transglycosylase D